ncbi:MAG TPA: ferrochelatase, partial [Pseudonocardiaceae bacterium]|nr:ferrochelatase [Pseudonocardiaceae bacterium]
MVDALLLLSFGGPEGPSEVRPFLENVTRGRGVPPQRLDEVAQHYLHFGGVSPINRCNRTLITGIEQALATAGFGLPVYFGNRNWHPMVEDTVAAMATDGVRRALVFATSAWGGYSGCRQYHEDIARARHAVGPGAPELMKLRHFFDHPLFIAACADALRTARVQACPAARVVFTAHSVPLVADATAGLAAQGGHRYSQQITAAARLVAAAVGVGNYDVVWQSRSGPPQVPWLEPDVTDHLDSLHAQGVPGVVVAPIGFVSDHLEVVWDLDHEARQRAATLGMDFVRAATPGTDPRFAEMVVELIAEDVRDAPARRCSQVPAAG